MVLHRVSFLFYLIADLSACAGIAYQRGEVVDALRQVLCVCVYVPQYSFLFLPLRMSRMRLCVQNFFFLNLDEYIAYPSAI